MATHKELEQVVCVLRSGLRKKIVLQVPITNRAVQQTLKSLEKRDFIKVLETAKGQCKLIISSITSEIILANCTVKSKNILTFASKVLPSITGVLIISTPKGVMTHEQAHEKNLGGRVILAVY